VSGSGPTQTALMLRLGARDDILLWRNNTGKAKDTRTGQVVTFGLKGSSDLLGLMRGGRMLCIEVKSDRDRLRPEQVVFRDRVVALGGLHILVRPGGEDIAVAAVMLALRGAL
jgi:hypothetical protein